MVSQAAFSSRRILSGSRLLRATALAVMVVILGVQLVTFWPATIDDAFISYRYADNWAHGEGLTFNPGEKVEGYSNFLWVASVAVLSRAGVDPVLGGKVLGVTSLLALLCLGWQALARAGYREFEGVAALGLLGTSYSAMIFQAVGGLETLMYAALLMSVLYSLQRSDNQLTFPAAALLLLVALSRPEGIAYTMALAPVLWQLSRGQRRRIALLLLVVLGYLAFVAWRRYYFGALWPNTFYAKPSTMRWAGVLGIVANAWSVLPEATSFLASMGGPLVIGFVVYAALHRQCRHLLLPATTVILTGLAFQIYAGPDWMQISRFLIPIWMPVVVLGLAGWHKLAQRLEPCMRRSGLALWIGLAVLSNLSAGHQFWTARHAYPNFVLTSEDMISASQWIGQNYPSSYSITCWRIGALGYYSRLRVIDDVWGLTDSHIARLRHTDRLTEETRNAYLAQRNPELVMSRGYSSPAAAAITVGGRQYLFVRRFPQGSAEWWDLYQRADLQ